jgi:hypothetical protein
MGLNKGGEGCSATPSVRAADKRCIAIQVMIHAPFLPLSKLLRICLAASMVAASSGYDHPCIG